MNPDQFPNKSEKTEVDPSREAIKGEFVELAKKDFKYLSGRTPTENILPFGALDTIIRGLEVFYTSQPSSVHGQTTRIELSSEEVKACKTIRRRIVAGGMIKFLQDNADIQERNKANMNYKRKTKLPAPDKEYTPDGFAKFDFKDALVAVQQLLMDLQMLSMVGAE